MQNISQRVHAVRTARGWTQGQLAEHIRYGRHYVSLVERGQAKNPRPRFVEAIELLEREAAATSSSGESNIFVAREPQLSPPHFFQEARTKDDAPTFGSGCGAEEYTEAVELLGKLFHTKPAIFKSALMMLRGLMAENHTTKK